MAVWGLYFFSKIFLSLQGIITLSIPLNILFALFLLFQPLEKWRFYNLLQKIKGLAHLIFGVSLLWHDSYFPPPYDIYVVLNRDGLPSSEYIYTFLSGYYRQDVVVAVVIALFASIVVSHYIKIINVAILCLLLLIPYNVSGQTNKQSLDEHLEEFFNDEERKSVSFNHNSSAKLDFNIIFIHICSLSWDDLYFTRLDQHLLFRQFDYIFENFNSATTYSGPAMIRIMNASCGQKTHANLYKPASEQCHIFQALSNIGFDTTIALNHDGEYGHFKDQIREYGGIPKKPMPLDGFKRKMSMFDNSPVYDDFEILNNWLNYKQKKSANKPSLLYYNTVSLHDGVYAKSEKGLKDDTKALYSIHLKTLLDEIKDFFKVLENSGKKFIVVFIPEHGMALRGSRIQKSTLRDIPLPDITRVPVGIKLIGGKYNNAEPTQHKISKSTSYLAVANVLSQFIEKSPFTSEQYASRKFIDSIPITDFVSENDGGISTKYDGKYFFKMKGKSWVEYKN